MSFRHKGLVFAMEENTEVLDAEPAEVLNEVETSVGEAEEQGGEVSELSTAIEEAVEDVETLENVQDVMADSADKGEGLDETAAEIAEVAVESICARLGIRRTMKTIPSLESFGSATSRVTATRIAVENIGKRLAAAWEAIKKAFAAMWTKIKEFFKRHFDANTKLQAAADKLLAAANALGEKKPANSAFENAGLYKGLAVAGKADHASTQQILSVVSDAIGTVSAVGASVQTAIGLLEKLIETAKKTDTNYGFEVSKSFGGVLKTFKSIKGIKEAKDGDNITITVGPLPYGKTILVTASNSNDPKTKTVFSVSEVETGDQGGSKDINIPVLSIGEMSGLCKEVKALSEKNDDARKFDSLVEGVGKKFDALIDKAVKQLQTLDGAKDDVNSDSFKEELAIVRMGVTKLGNGFAGYATRSTSAAVTAGKLALGYVSASLKQYK